MIMNTLFNNENKDMAIKPIGKNFGLERINNDKFILYRHGIPDKQVEFIKQILISAFLLLIWFYLFYSKDNGVSWQGPRPITNNYQHPGHLLLLDDGRVLFTYGNRSNADGGKGVLAKLSDDQGKTWSPPIRIAHLGGDLGYPSSVQRADGKMLLLTIQVTLKTINDTTWVLRSGRCRIPIQAANLCQQLYLQKPIDHIISTVKATRIQ